MGHHSCCNKQKVRRGLWSPEEDEKLINYISTYGHGCWSSVPRLAGLQRCGKSCRLRWINYLRPDLKRGNFSTQEAFLIIELHRILGNRWSQIAKHLPGRTDNEVKNFWNSSIKKKHISLHDVSNHVGSDQNLLPMNANPNLILDAQQDHFQLPNSTSMLQIYDHGDLKPDSMDYTVNSVEMPPPPPPLSLDGSLSYPEWSWDYQPHYHDDHHQSHPLEDDQSVEMYGNGEIMCQTQVDAKFTLTSYDDEPLVGSTMPKLCETFDMDECGMSSSASHEVDPSTGLPCFPSQAYPYYPHVPTSIMPSSSSFKHFDMNPSRPSSSNWYP